MPRSGTALIVARSPRKSKRNAGGKIVAKVVPDTRAATLLPHVQTKVLPKSAVYTDEWASYNKLGKMGYERSRVRHSQHVYVSGDAHTNTIEGFWSLLKREISGVYHGVYTKHLQSYVNEYVSATTTATPKVAGCSRRL